MKSSKFLVIFLMFISIATTGFALGGFIATNTQINSLNNQLADVNEELKENVDDYNSGYYVNNRFSSSGSSAFGEYFQNKIQESSEELYKINLSRKNNINKKITKYEKYKSYFRSFLIVSILLLLLLVSVVYSFRLENIKNVLPKILPFELLAVITSAVSAFLYIYKENLMLSIIILIISISFSIVSTKQITKQISMINS